MNLKHFVFDLDGTLIDTEKAVLKTWVKTLNEYGYDFSEDEARVVLGVVASTGLERLGAEVDENFMQRWQQNYVDYANEVVFFPKVEDMLLKLKEKGCTLGVVTSRCRKEINEFFSEFNLEKYFNTIIVEDDTEKHKPYAQPLLKYMEVENADREECIYIGDMPGDIHCANNAGVLSALVKWNGSDVECEDADMCFSSVDEVISLV